MHEHIVTPTVISHRKTGAPDQFFGPGLAAAVNLPAVCRV